MRSFHLFLFLLIFVFPGILAQDPARDYLVAAGNQAVIYHGKEQVKYPPNILNHPYLGEDTYEAGDLSFEGILYKDVKMRIDLCRGELMVLSADNRFNIILPGDRVDYARLRGYHIFYHFPDSSKGCPPEGYYLRLYDSGLKVLERQSFILFRKTVGLEVESSFIRTVKYYVYKDGVYYTVKSKGSVLRLFKERKAELARFIRQEQFNFKEDPERSIVEVVKEYERLSGKP